MRRRRDHHQGVGSPRPAVRPAPGGKGHLHRRCPAPGIINKAFDPSSASWWPTPSGRASPRMPPAPSCSPTDMDRQELQPAGARTRFGTAQATTPSSRTIWPLTPTATRSCTGIRSWALPPGAATSPASSPCSTIFSSSPRAMSTATCSFWRWRASSTPGAAPPPCAGVPCGTATPALFRAHPRRRRPAPCPSLRRAWCGQVLGLAAPEDDWRALLLDALAPAAGGHRDPAHRGGGGRPLPLYEPSPPRRHRPPVGGFCGPQPAAPGQKRRPCPAQRLRGFARTPAAGSGQLARPGLLSFLRGVTPSRSSAAMSPTASACPC